MTNTQQEKPAETKRVGVVQTGTANLASVLAALRRAGTAPYLLQDPQMLRDAEYLVLPGVGTFGAAMESLHQAQLVKPLQERIQQNHSTFAICLGLQLLCTASEESPGVEGLGILPSTVQRFQEPLRIPQFGWSPVVPAKRGGFFEEGYAYFANSYCLTDLPDDWDVALSEYGASYVASMCKGRVVACQFHPELSDAWGHQLIMNWLAL